MKRVVKNNLDQQLINAMILYHELLKESFKIASKYFILVFSFPVGIFFGGFLSTLCGIYAIWFCCIILLFLTSLIKYENK